MKKKTAFMFHFLSRVVVLDINVGYPGNVDLTWELSHVREKQLGPII